MIWILAVSRVIGRLPYLGLLAAIMLLMFHVCACGLARSDPRQKNRVVLVAQPILEAFGSSTASDLVAHDEYYRAFVAQDVGVLYELRGEDARHGMDKERWMSRAKTVLRRAGITGVAQLWARGYATESDGDARLVMLFYASDRDGRSVRRIVAPARFVKRDGVWRCMDDGLLDMELEVPGVILLDVEVGPRMGIDNWFKIRGRWAQN